MDRRKVYIRIARPEDTAAILKIYAPYIEKTVISFEYDVPSLGEFRKRLENTLVRHPYIVAISDGEISGYAYTREFVGRKAADWSVETTIYLKENQTKQGLGKLLYEAIEAISKAQNITNLNASIAYPDVEDEYLNRNSAEFHEYLGYRFVGKFHNCAYKFGRWYNLIWMEKIIGEHQEKPLPVIPFSELSDEVLLELGVER